MFHNRIIVPGKEKERVLKEIHRSHHGIKRCISRDKESVWWFGITEDIKIYGTGPNYYILMVQVIRHAHE